MMVDVVDILLRLSQMTSGGCDERPFDSRAAGPRPAGFANANPWRLGFAQAAYPKSRFASYRCSVSSKAGSPRRVSVSYSAIAVDCERTAAWYQASVVGGCH